MLRFLEEEYVIRRRLLLKIRAYSVDSTIEGKMVRGNLEAEFSLRGPVDDMDGFYQGLDLY
jgi:hypothetical protein